MVEPMVSLRDLIEQRFDLLDERISSELRRIDMELASFVRLTDERWTADRRALEASKEEAKERLLAHNGLIEQMRERAEKLERQAIRERSAYVTSSELVGVEKGISQRLDSIEKKLDQYEGASYGKSRLGNWIFATIGAVGVLAALVAVANALMS